jgi:hypothetical protein
MSARGLIVVAAALVAAAFPAAAGATAPTVELVPVNEVIPLSGADSPCPFDLVFTSTGTVKMTTFYDNSGTPIRQSVHGALTHTIGSAWHTLVSNGPAPVHVDLATGDMVDTGKEYAFHVPGDGIVFGVDGRLTLAPDGTQLAFDGNEVVNADELCAALAP